MAQPGAGNAGDAVPHRVREADARRIGQIGPEAVGGGQPGRSPINISTMRAPSMAPISSPSATRAPEATTLPPIRVPASAPIRQHALRSRIEPLDEARNIERAMNRIARPCVVEDEGEQRLGGHAGARPPQPDAHRRHVRAGR